MNRASVLILTCAFLTVSAFAAAAASKAGTEDSVKKWPNKTNDEAKAAKRPILLYIYDATEKKNDIATLLEGPKFLDTPEVKSAEKGFLCIKIKSTDGDGYPHDWMQLGDRGAALLVISADMKLVQAFDKSTKDSNTAEALLKAMETAQKAAPAAPPAPAPDKNAANNNKKNANGKNNPKS